MDCQIMHEHIQHHGWYDLSAAQIKAEIRRLQGLFVVSPKHFMAFIQPGLKKTRQPIIYPAVPIREDGNRKVRTPLCKGCSSNPRYMNTAEET